MNNSKQESKNELKVISRIEVNTKPQGYDETVARIQRSLVMSTKL